MTLLSTMDARFMARAIELAERGLYSTSPNPRVGCVLVKDDSIVSEGWHQKAGESHAEVNALDMAGKQAEGATAYVTLEPCSHTGRTPPCAHALINAGIRRVVGAMTDPNPQVSGRGYQILRDAGIDIVTSCLEEDARRLNPGFVKRMTTALPYVRIKLAHSLDGRTAMASGESQWITGAPARSDVQRLRARSCVVLTGADSVLQDNPAMAVRPEETGIEQEKSLWRQPLRVIVDSQNRVPDTANIFQQGGDILIATRSMPSQPITSSNPTQSRAINYWVSPGTSHGRIDLKELLLYLAQQGHNEVLVETGATLAGAMISQQLVDEMVLYCAPTLLGSAARPLLSLPLDHMAQQYRWHWQDVRMVGDDLRLTLTPDTADHKDTNRPASASGN